MWIDKNLVGEIEPIGNESALSLCSTNALARCEPRCNSCIIIPVTTVTQPSVELDDAFPQALTWQLGGDATSVRSSMGTPLRFVKPPLFE